MKNVLGAVTSVVLVGLPFVADTYAIATITQIVTYSLLALSLLLMMGHAGMPSLGQAGFFGVGGYTAGLVAMHWTSNAVLVLLSAVLAATAVAAGTGWLLVRSKHSYLIMLTLAIGEILSFVAIAWVSVTGGSDGLANVPYFTLAPADLSIPGQVYWFVLVVAAVIVLVLRQLLRSPFGRSVRGIRDNEQRMRALGYRTRVYKFAVLCVAGAISGAAGALWVTQTHYISPGDMGFLASAFALLAVVIGGVHSMWGVTLGAAVIILVQNLLPEDLQGAGPLVLGLVLVLAVYLLPNGIASVRVRT